MMHHIPFKSEHHSITVELEQYVTMLLSQGNITLKAIATMTGLGKNTVKQIDIRRLRGLYTIDGKSLIQPNTTAKFLAIDEFKLHNGHQYATHIINLENTHILWIAKGKKKQVVYDFIEHVGLEWMSCVVAIACDMNSDFQEAFQDKCPDIQVVYDPFHIVKNFNDKVISEVRKDEQRRLIDEGNFEAARMLKRTRHILMSSKETLDKKDEQARNQTCIKKGSPLFNTGDVTRKEGLRNRYEALINENSLLHIIDIIKTKLRYAYSLKNEIDMVVVIDEILELCWNTKNKHLLWFRKLLTNHYEGIIAHGTHHISSGKIEGINNKIKTLRRQGYGYPDDEYFFLKIIDASRNTYTRNPKSHKICG